MRALADLDNLMGDEIEETHHRNLAKFALESAEMEEKEAKEL
jgi:hypothetical protein